ncbi:cell division protein FtsL [Alteribacter populi]|uniref:cell division protein FtsL n=1 Tax=Alteribacter populi TaxID=2011011 RepID=UPI000BBB3B56|nr:cell division protein FtsL [Alteribacter populi]
MSLADKQVQHQQHSMPQHETKTLKQRVFKGGLTKGERIIYPLALLGVIVVAYMMVSNYASIYIANHHIQQTEQVIAEQTTVNDGLTLQVKELSDPDRILQIAQNELGMELDDQNVRVIQNQD